MTELTSLEVCAGAGGQALGLEAAGFGHAALVEIDMDAAQTLARNRPHWLVHQKDIRDIEGRNFRGIDLLSGGVPCPPFSVAGHQLGSEDERDLFPEAVRLVRESRPAAVMLENVRGLASPRFDSYRAAIQAQLASMGYESDWRVINASDHGVPQLRPRFILVAMKSRAFARFRWPDASSATTTVADKIADLMGSEGWPGLAKWRVEADRIGPTLVGGSRKHGGPDLGPTRAREQWLKLRVDGRGIADSPPTKKHARNHLPRLTLQMTARIQGFPDEWEFFGRKTSAYRQIGNAFPPPVAAAVGRSIGAALA